jgi:DNA-directed RNA polymerase subunit M/transcription elongation factor TFIIS
MVEFCDRCGSFMQMGDNGYECPRCGWQKIAMVIAMKTGPDNEAEPVYVMSGLDDAIKVQRICPSCGHGEAYRNITVAIGEHAGVKSDRSVERFKCAKCGHTWVVN